MTNPGFSPVSSTLISCPFIRSVMTRQAACAARACPILAEPTWRRCSGRPVGLSPRGTTAKRSSRHSIRSAACGPTTRTCRRIFGFRSRRGRRFLARARRIPRRLFSSRAGPDVHGGLPFSLAALPAGADRSGFTAAAPKAPLPERDEPHDGSCAKPAPSRPRCGSWRGLPRDSNTPMPGDCSTVT